MNLTTGDLLELTDEIVLGRTAGVVHPGGLSPKELRSWVRQGVITPATGGDGSGNHAGYTWVQAVAVVVATAWWRNGGGLETTRKMVECITAYDEPGLRRAVKQGRAFAVVLPGSLGCQLLKVTPTLLGMLAVTKLPETLDLRKLLPWIDRRLKKMRGRPANPSGRSRGTQQK